MHERDKSILVREWLDVTRTQVNSRKVLRKVQPLFWNRSILMESCQEENNSMTAVMQANTEEVPALQITIEEEILARMIQDQNQLKQLMRLPEVREAVMYYTLNGYLKD
jgi:hypothetical protein